MGSVKNINIIIVTQGFSINQKDGRVDTFTILFVIVYAILLVKFRRYIGAFEASLTPMIIGLISSFLTLPLHELLHAICISSKNNVQIYRVKSGLTTWFTAPITKRRYLGMLLVPVLLLGFIPSICTFVIPETMPGFITFVLIFSLGNIGMSCGDLTNFIITAIKVKKGNKVLPCKNGIFKVQ